MSQTDRVNSQAVSCVCFVAPRAYPVLSGSTDARHIGGAEVQQVLIARGLAARGYRVNFVTLDHDQPDGQDLGGIRVYRAYRPDAGIRKLRCFHPRVTRVWAAMKRADADVYYQRSSDSLTGVVAAFCQRHRHRFVFGIANDADVRPELPHCEGMVDRVLYRRGLCRADCIVAQTLSQKRSLRESFGLESVGIRNAVCLAEPTSAESSGDQKGGRPSVLWIGRFVPDKRLDWLLEVASRCAEIDFEVLGDGPKSVAVADLERRAAQIPNIRMRGYVHYQQIGAHYAGARALVCTSSMEGFPNTFLEAWSRGIPVVTTFDPDGVVAAHNLGIRADTVDSLAEAVRMICLDRELQSRLGQSAYEYFRAHHTIEIAIEAYDRLFRRLLRQEPQAESDGHATSI